MNPVIKYDVLKSLYYENIKNFWIFHGKSQDEVMFVVHELEPMLVIENETIIYQGDVGDTAFIIQEGKVQIIIKKTATSDILDDLNNDVKLKSFINKKKKRKTFKE